MEYEQLREAYLDSELSASEAAEFDAALSEADRAGLLAEQRFLRGVTDALACEVPCPDALWERTQQAMRGGKSTRQAWRRFGTAATVLAAASIALVVSMSLGNISEETSVVMAARSIEELRAESEIPPGEDAAEAYLAERGIPFTLEPGKRPETAQMAHMLRVVGAKTNHVWGDDVVSMLVVCCDTPVKVVFAKKKSEAAKAIGEAAATSDQIQVLKPVNDYLLAVVGNDHGEPYITDIFVQD